MSSLNDKNPLLTTPSMVEWDNSSGKIINSLSISTRMKLTHGLDIPYDATGLRDLDTRLRKINSQMVFLSFLVVVSMIISNQLCFDDDDLVYRYPCDAGALCSIVEWCLSIIAVQRYTIDYG